MPFDGLTTLAENKEILMKSASFISCAVLVLLLVGLVGAQTRGSAPQKLTADVPFDFMVRQVMFPAGNYVVSVEGDQTFHLRARRGRDSSSITAEPIRTVSHPGGACLIFAEENGHLQLRELWVNATTGREIPAPPMELLRTVRASRVEVPASCTTCE
jgi:hypothetical protein